MSNYTVEWEIYLKSGQTVHVTTSHYIKIEDDMPHLDDTECQLKDAIKKDYDSFVFEEEENADMVFIVPSQVSGFKNKVIGYPEEEQA